ncbi:hypothetical protein GCM10009007_12780 [Formosimonas limnophila]|uniref:Uncharacterized protein n=1 Tax=Formosimonas limnophila TaxID=1384487 RepID=A0A8J3G0N5_9BURK|nr:hypothetical protein GCM10009007_12780 [Formosimonas limnophila]
MSERVLVLCHSGQAEWVTERVQQRELHVPEWIGGSLDQRSNALNQRIRLTVSHEGFLMDCSVVSFIAQ